METHDNDSMVIFVEPDIDAQLDTQGERPITQLEVHLDRWLDDALVEGPIEFAEAPGRKIPPQLDDEVTRKKVKESLGPINCEIFHVLVADCF